MENEGKPTKTTKIKNSEAEQQQRTIGKKVVKATVNTYHTINHRQLAGLQTPTKHSKEDIQMKRVEKEARSQYYIQILAEFPRLT